MPFLITRDVTGKRDGVTVCHRFFFKGDIIGVASC
jgi:hypothetical protein